MTHAADTYTKLCDNSSRLPDVFDFLSKSAALCEQEILDVILVDQFHRWKQNQSVPVEHYLSRVPEISGIHAVPLAVEEYGHLEERGVAPAPSEFVQRFLFLGPEAIALLCEELDVDPAYRTDLPNTSTAKKSVGRYEVVCSIGCGAFGEVFLGKDPDLERSVAIKVLNRQQPTGKERSERLLREARLIAQLDHPNIVPIFDFGMTEDGDCYIVSKYIRGQELKAELRKPIAHLEAARITASLARALHVAHNAGVIHRDVKPANIILDRDRIPHLLDFGLALNFGLTLNYGLALGMQNATSEKALVGTPAYMSPEQARCESQSIDGRSDIYSLGVVFYEMLARRRPFQDRGLGEPLDLLDSKEVQPPRQFADSIPRELERICLKALSHSMSERYNTAADFAEEIESWIAESSSNKHRLGNGSSDENTESAQRWKDYTQLPEGPSVAVIPFANLGGDNEGSGIASGLTDEVITQLAKFKDLFILGKNATVGLQAESVDVQNVGQQLGVEYLLTGSVRQSSDQLRVSAQLIDTSTMAHVWGDSFRGNLSTQDVFDIEDEIARKVAISLGLHHGVIAMSRKSTKQSSAIDMDAYDCVTQFYENWRAYTPTQQYPKVRQDLEATVARQPHYYAAWAALAFVYLDGYVLDFGVPEAPEEILVLAGEAATRAAEGSPQDARALHALFRYEFHCQRIDAFIEGVEKAIVANPNETSMLADAATCLAAIGEWDRALPLIRKAIALDPNPPVWYHAADCWHALANGDYETALTFANRMISVAVYWGPAFRACALGHLDRIPEAQEQLQVLIEMQPDFAQRAARELHVWNVCEELQTAVMGGLAKAGMSG